MEQRTARSRTVVGEDGWLQAEVYATPVHFRGPDGAWEPIDNALVRAEEPGYAWRNAANSYRLLLPADLAAAPVRATLGEEWVSLALRDASGAPEVTGNAAVYRQALSGVDVAYRAMPGGVKEELVLASAAAQSTFTFDVETSVELVASENDAGGIDFTREGPDGAEEPVFSFATPFMRDASEGSEDLDGTSQAVDLRIVETSPGLVVELAADRAWLEDPQRVFPVVVDPTVIFDHAGQDAYIFEGDSYGGAGYSDELVVGTSTAGNRFRGLVQFPLDLPETAVVQEATFDLFLSADPSPEPTSGVTMHRLEEYWQSSYVTWEQAVWPELHWQDPGGTFEPTGFASSTAIDESVSGWVNWPLTDLVQGWVHGTVENYGVLVKAVDETEGNLLRFASNQADSGHWPRLTVSYYVEGDDDSQRPSISSDGR